MEQRPPVSPGDGTWTWVLKLETVLIHGPDLVLDSSLAETEDGCLPWTDFFWPGGMRRSLGPWSDPRTSRVGRDGYLPCCCSSMNMVCLLDDYKSGSFILPLVSKHISNSEVLCGPGSHCKPFPPLRYKLRNLPFKACSKQPCQLALMASEG